MAAIEVGQLFASFDELDFTVKQYCEKTFIQLWMRDAWTLAAASKRVPKKVASVADEGLKYYCIKYCCIHGGQRFRPRGEGQRQTA